MPRPSADLPDQIITQLQAGRTEAEIRERLPAASADAILAEARKRLAEHSNFDRRVELGLARLRLQAIVGLVSVSDEGLFDARAALAAQKELNRLHGLDRPAESDEASAELAAIAADAQAAREHLSRLNLAPADAPLAELARLAVSRICELGTAVARR